MLWLPRELFQTNIFKTMHTVQKTIVGAQFLFVAFGATVLVPLLIGLEPSVALFTAGVGTLIFHAATKGKVPILKAFDWRFVWNNRNRWYRDLA